MDQLGKTRLSMITRRIQPKRSEVVVVVALVVAMADGDRSARGHDLLRLSRDQGMELGM